MMDFEHKRKAKQLHDYFMQQGRIFIVVDATQDNVELPQHCLEDPSLRLILNTRMPHRIIIDDKGVHTTLSFGGIAHTCFIPLDSIWAAYFSADEDMFDKGLVWEESMPALMRTMFNAILDEGDAKLADDDADADDIYTIKTTEPTPNNRRAHLRIIK
ncbi:MAG: ClpXP protease specificity-enhancing factor SspB [Mariprofundales bacterium]